MSAYSQEPARAILGEPTPKMRGRLMFWTAHVEAVFLARQHPVTGLLPASTAHTSHGNYGHAWVRDNVYSVLGVWTLSRAWRRWGGECLEAQRLEQATVATMRGLLGAMMGQAAKVERFKFTEDPIDCLHAKYDTESGAPVVGDDGWGHLQLDATGLFLLYLAQMTKAGLHIVRTRPEARFVQNLVHYVGPAYRTPDYGIWERGDKRNTGQTEINASSVGMVKAALEAMQDLTFNLEDGTSEVVRIAPDDVARARETLAALLPLESASKESDAALLGIVGWPAYALEDAILAARTREKVLSKLQGEYGCKRFLRDGHQTVIEDATRLHYLTGELGQFEHIESEWPLFFTYISVDAALRHQTEERDRYLARLDRLAVVQDGVALLPELYVVPEELIAAEIAMPGTQARIPNANLPLFWAQSLWVVAHALAEGLVTPHDIDPLGRRERLGARIGTSVQLVLQADDEAAATQIEGLGLPCLTPSRSGILADGLTYQVSEPHWLAHTLTGLGAEPSLGLTGRPPKRLSAMITARAYEQAGRIVLFTPASLDASSSYMRFDAATLAHRIRTDISYINRHWIETDPPVITVPLSGDAFDGEGAAQLRSLLAAIAGGDVDGVRVSVLGAPDLPRLRPVSLSGLPTVPDSAPTRSSSASRYDAAGARHDWRAVRAEAEALGRSDERLPDALKEIIVRLRRVSFLPAWAPQECIERPLSAEAIRTAIRAHAPEWPHAVVLAEETLQHLGVLIRTSPEAFLGCRTLRLWDLVNLLVRQDDFGPVDVDGVLALPPHILARRIRHMIESTPGVRKVLAMTDLPFETSTEWRAWRTRLGVLTRVGEGFFLRVWRALHQIDGLVIGPANREGQRIDATHMRSDFTPMERKFANHIDDLLSAIEVPSYRTLTLEAMNALACQCEANPLATFEGDIVLDEIIHAAVLKDGQEDAWARFGALPPDQVFQRLTESLQLHLTRKEAIPA